MPQSQKLNRDVEATIESLGENWRAIASDPHLDKAGYRRIRNRIDANILTLRLLLQRRDMIEERKES